MEKTLEKIKRVLESDAGVLKGISNDLVNFDNKDVDVEEQDIKGIIDNRFELIKGYIDSSQYKKDVFYYEVIKLISSYLDKLNNSNYEDWNGIVFDKEGNLIPQNPELIDDNDMSKIRDASCALSENLFLYVCDILENNKDIKLDKETLKRLFNRHPKLFTHSVEESYLYDIFDYKKLANILTENETLKKSNLSLDDLYQLMIDSFQINNEEVVKIFIQPEDFKNNHQKIDEFLEKCNARTFVEETRIIRRLYDKDFDRLSIVKKRNNNNFCERVIIELLGSSSDPDDFDFIHHLLTDDSIEINYDYDSADYIGQTSLKELLAFSGNKDLIKELLSKEENIQNNYWHGESNIPLYRLYAIIGDYEKALSLFQENYYYASDYTEDFNDDFNRRGYTYGSIVYQDSLVSFIESICSSFKKENVDYEKKKDIISSILNSDNVKCVNLEETLNVVSETLSEDDVNLLFNDLMERHNAGELDFITVTDCDGLYFRYIIKTLSDQELEENPITLNNEGKNKVLQLTLPKKGVSPDSASETKK